MAVDFDKFNKMFDVEGLKADIEEAAAFVPGEYVEVPCGTYEVKLTQLELGESKTSGNPMVKARFKVLAGDYKGQTIFYNQVVKEGFQIHIVNQFLRSMETGLDIAFENWVSWANLLGDVFKAVDKKKEFALEYGETNKGFKTYAIKEVFNK